MPTAFTHEKSSMPRSNLEISRSRCHFSCSPKATNKIPIGTSAHALLRSIMPVLETSIGCTAIIFRCRSLSSTAATMLPIMYAMPTAEKAMSADVYSATPATTYTSEAATQNDTSMRSPVSRSITIVTIGAMLRTTMMAPMVAWSSASIEEASMSVNRIGIVSAQRITSRREPKCRPQGNTTRHSTVNAICIITMVMGSRAARSTSLLMTSMPALQTMKNMHEEMSAAR
mmetsp:Transcript_30365/g.78748  ORF Transcript_30365/g.78748 Transcript_30365/m.78748 type:complete len:229 (+) Transcript_30365:370-1056(+)